MQAPVSVEQKQNHFTGFSSNYLTLVKEAYDQNNLAPAREFLQLIAFPDIHMTIALNNDLNKHTYALITYLSKGSLRQEVQKCEAVIKLKAIFNSQDVLIVCKGGVRIGSNELELCLESEFFSRLFQTGVGKSVKRNAKGQLEINFAQVVCGIVFQNYLYSKTGACPSFTTFDWAKLYAFADFIQDNKVKQKCLENLPTSIFNGVLLLASSLEETLHLFETTLVCSTEDLIAKMSTIAICVFFNKKGYTTTLHEDGFYLSVNATGFLNGESYLANACKKYLKGLLIPYSFKMEKLPLLKTIDEEIRKNCSELLIQYLNVKDGVVKEEDLKPFKDFFPDARIKVIGVPSKEFSLTFRHDKVGYCAQGFVTHIDAFKSSLDKALIVQCSEARDLHYAHIPKESYILFVDENFNVIHNLNNQTVLGNNDDCQFPVRGLYHWGRDVGNGVLRLN